MDKNTNLLKMDDEKNHFEEGQGDFECNRCGERFLKPLLTRVSSNGSTQTYYACPRCLTDISEAEKTQDEKSEQPAASPEQIEAPEGPQELNCQYSLGYLRKRPRDVPIPDTCLTCEKMIECLTYQDLQSP
jgi:predicted RNA-binding Zn-ribbon protein involved in translation (DUF1610 family)